MTLTYLSLFSGIGGLDLAAEWAGFTTVGQCEFADYPTKILERHWPDVPRWRDIRTLTGESFHERTSLETVDVISGGFPCQPFSVAGKQKGKGDDRYLWPEMLRVIRELKPCWVIGENVPGILKLAAADVVADLEREGYNVVVFDFEAAAVGAMHRRERIAFVANARSDRQRRSRDVFNRRSIPEKDRKWAPIKPYKSGKVSRPVADTKGTEREIAAQSGRPSGEARVAVDGSISDPDHGQCVYSNEKIQTRRDPATSCGWRAAQPGLGGMADGIPARLDKARWLTGYLTNEPDIPRIAKGMPNRVDRLKALGNAVVPQQFYPIFKAIAEVER